jgi:hypothetical protein
MKKRAQEVSMTRDDRAGEKMATRMTFRWNYELGWLDLMGVAGCQEQRTAVNGFSLSINKGHGAGSDCTDLRDDSGVMMLVNGWVRNAQVMGQGMHK